MIDRELLELAAKAAGIKIYESTDGTIQNRPVWVFKAGGAMGTMPYEEQWNPLRDDATALRLAVKLRLIIDPVAKPLDGSEPSAAVMAPGSRRYVVEPFAGDPYAATRRAIVRVAAEIGKGMK